jgi:LacI family transcriptional regulator
MHGQQFSSDSNDRWMGLVEVAKRLGLVIKPELVVSLDRDMTSPELGYPVVQQLLATKQPFTALVAFNDISAIGAIRALQDLSLSVPRDVSVIGFDDIKGAAFAMPRLTTIRQPLAEIGRIATQSLLNRIHGTATPRDEIVVEPKLIVRESTGPVKAEG